MSHRKIATMATFPARKEVMLKAIETVVDQVDRLYVCANGYDGGLDAGPKVEFHYPDRDQKDVGKFVFDVAATDLVFLMDDDISYPADYTETMAEHLDRYSALDGIVGLHGVTYTDLFDGNAANRSVQVFHRSLEQDIFVNQVGTGTVCCWGRQMPDKAFMEGSERFVDVRFAVHQERSNRPRIAVARQSGWLTEIDGEGESIFSTFTKTWPTDVVREVQEIAGYSRLPSLLPASEVLEKTAA